MACIQIILWYEELFNCKILMLLLCLFTFLPISLEFYQSFYIMRNVTGCSIVNIFLSWMYGLLLTFTHYLDCTKLCQFKYIYKCCIGWRNAGIYTKVHELVNRYDRWKRICILIMVSTWQYCFKYFSLLYDNCLFLIKSEVRDVWSSVQEKLWVVYNWKLRLFVCVLH